MCGRSVGSVSHYPGRVRPLLPAVVAALVAPVLPVLAAAPAGAANDQDPRTIDKRTVYTCSSEVLGTGDFETFVRVQLPRTVTAGKKMAARPIDLSIVVPEDMTQAMRDYGVEEVSGRSDDATYKVGKKKRKIRRLEIPATEVPAEGLLVLEGTGTAQAVRLNKVDTYPVKLPKRFSATVSVTGAFSFDDDLTCRIAKGAKTKIGSVRVVP